MLFYFLGFSNNPAPQPPPKKPAFLKFIARDRMRAGRFNLISSGLDFLLNHVLQQYRKTGAPTVLL